MAALPKMSPADPLVDMRRWPWPYGPFVLADLDGNRWKLSARDPYRSGQTARLECELTTEIEGVEYRIRGGHVLSGEGTPRGEAYLSFLWPATGYAPPGGSVPRRVQRRALAMVKRVLDGPYATAAFVRAAAVAKLPLAEQMKIDEQTHLSLASVEEIAAEIARLREELRPGGGEDQATAHLIAELVAIRVNAARKRRQIEEKAEALHARTQFRAEKKEALARCQARLAELQQAE